MSCILSIPTLPANGQGKQGYFRLIHTTIRTVTMKNNLSELAKSFLIVSLFAFITAIAGCSADSLTGVQDQEPPEAPSDCRGSDCPNGHNL